LQTNGRRYDGFGMQFGGALSNSSEILVEKILGGKERGK
jgi:hypothetical protein